MKDRDALLELIDELIKKEFLPNGKKISRHSVAEYIFVNEPNVYHYKNSSTGTNQAYAITGIERIAWNRIQLKKGKLGHEPRHDVLVKDKILFEPAKGEAKEEKSLADKIKQRLYNKNEKPTIEQLTDLFDCGSTKIKEAIEQLRTSGYNITLEGDHVIFDSTLQKSEATLLNIPKGENGFYKMGVCGDNHLCSKYERLDVLNALYDHYEKEGITVVYNTGNWIDGEARFNTHDIHTHGIDKQLKYFVENYPQRKGIVTKLITGDDHEGWYTQRAGIDIGRRMQTDAFAAGREDLIYLGHMEHDEIIKAPNGQTKLRILHPGGGSSYAISYTSQKIVESYTGGDKPDILFDGHYHKAGYNFIRGVHVIQTGCTQDQTPFMRKKKLAAHLGGWIIDFSTDDKGAVVRFRQEFFPFFDKAYYDDSWSYKFG